MSLADWIGSCRKKGKTMGSEWRKNYTTGLYIQKIIGHCVCSQTFIGKWPMPIWNPAFLMTIYYQNSRFWRHFIVKSTLLHKSEPNRIPEKRNRTRPELIVPRFRVISGTRDSPSGNVAYPRSFSTLSCPFCTIYMYEIWGLSLQCLGICGHLNECPLLAAGAFPKSEKLSFLWWNLDTVVTANVQKSVRQNISGG